MESEPEKQIESRDTVVFLNYGKKCTQPTAYRLTHPEAVFLRHLIAGCDRKEAALEAKISTESVRDLLARPEVAQYIEERLLQQAATAGVTKEKVLFVINHLLENPDVEVSQAHLKAIDMAAKILKLIQPGTVVNNTINESPFRNMDDSTFAQEFQRRMEYRGTKEISHDA